MTLQLKILRLTTLQLTTGQSALLALLIMLVFVVVPAQSQQTSLEVLSFESDEKKALYYQLTEEFRCLQCQNQNLAGSAAGLADDLKAQVYQMVQDGKTAAEIKSYMVARYGDFILYRPAFKPLTLMLWLFPFLLLACGIYVVYRFSRNRQPQSLPDSPTDADGHSNDAALTRARELLEHD